jgi:hypothetical protein
MSIVLILIPAYSLIIIVLGLTLNHRALLPGTKNYLRAQQERDARHHLMLARLRAIEDGHLDFSRKALEAPKP